jgi:hypothetical protein
MLDSTAFYSTYGGLSLIGHPYLRKICTFTENLYETRLLWEFATLNSLPCIFRSLRCHTPPLAKAFNGLKSNMGSSLTNISLLGMVTLSVVQALGYSAKASTGLALAPDSAILASSTDRANPLIAAFKDQDKEGFDIVTDLVSDSPGRARLAPRRLSQMPAPEPEAAPLQAPFLPDSQDPVETTPEPVPPENSDASEETTSEPLIPPTDPDSGPPEDLDAEAADNLLSAPDLLSLPEWLFPGIDG